VTAAPPEALDACRAAAAAVPSGAWAVGVSGGADSVALLLLLRDRPDLLLHVVHLDHETRGGASVEDARFVRTLAERLNLPCEVERRSTVEPTLDPLPANASARYRAARIALFRHVVRQQGLSGVVLAHHADDQAETVLHRLLRGSGVAGLAGMSPRSSIGGLTILRPLLGVRREQLRAVLRARGQAWREDASNASDAYVRNRLRRVLAVRPGLTEALVHLAASCRRFGEWLHTNTPDPGQALMASALLALPASLRRELARRWLAAAGVPRDRIEPDVVRRLVAMAEDAATPARQHYPGKVLVRRLRGVLTAHGQPSTRADDARAKGGTGGAPDRAHEV
jgi:tRNA(Ile)-lysidine synthase